MATPNTVEPESLARSIFLIILVGTFLFIGLTVLMVAA